MVWDSVSEAKNLLIVTKGCFLLAYTLLFNGNGISIVHQTHFIGPNRLPFTENRYLNGLNLPTHDRRHQVRARELVSQAVTLLAEFTQSLSNFYTYCEQRSRIYPCDGITEPLSAINSQVAMLVFILKLTTQDYLQFCLMQSLTSTNLSKIATFMSGNQEFFTQSAGYRTRGSSIGTDVVEGQKSNPAVVQFRQQAVSYIQSLYRPCPESVPHKVAVQNRKTILSSAESKEGLAKQITTFQQKVNKLEQEKEHWMLELQLFQIKFDNEVQKVKKLEKEAENVNISDSISYQTEVMANRIMEESRHKTSSVNSDDVEPIKLGSLENSDSANSDIETREKLIKDHFTNRINELTLHLQFADSKTVNFHSEVRALHKQLLILQNSKTLAEEELKSTNQVLAQLKDELQTTSRSYEGQLSMMSDHLAGMNEKLAQQKDEIDDLTGKLASASKKIRNQLEVKEEK